MKFLISIILICLTTVCTKAQTDSLLTVSPDTLRNDSIISGTDITEVTPDSIYAADDLVNDDSEPIIYELPTVLDSIFHFRQSLGRLPDSVQSNAYMKYDVNVLKRNITMFFVPKMDVLLTGTRKTFGESINKVTFYEGDKTESQVMVNSYTLSKSGARNVPSVISYLTPYIYNRTIFKSYIFSPFHRTNRYLYRYKLKMLGSWAELSFKPKIKNPQLIKGKALINPANGQVLTTTFKCDFRMYKLLFNIQMNDGSEPLADPNGAAVAALLPKRCNIEANMRFLWNKVDINYENTYELDIQLPDSISKLRDREMMDELRPYPLTDEEEALYQQYDSLHAPQLQDSIHKATHKKFSMKRLWTDYGRQLFRSHTAEIGNADFKLNPLIDPMQLLHSSTKGFIYRIKTRAVVQLGDNSAITFAPTGAYNFRRKRCYYELPLSWEFNERRNAHIQMNMYNTDPISNTGIKYEVKKYRTRMPSTSTR